MSSNQHLGPRGRLVDGDVVWLICARESAADTFAVNCCCPE
jgi:hypothetical protein